MKYEMSSVVENSQLILFNNSNEHKKNAELKKKSPTVCLSRKSIHFAEMSIAVASSTNALQLRHKDQ